MNSNLQLTIRLALVIATCTLALRAQAAPNAPLPPLRELTPTEINAVLGLPKLTPAQLGLKVAALTRAAAHGKGAPRLAVQRQAGSDAAVYSGLPVTTATLLPGTSASGQLADFVSVGDLAQSWATMTAAGVPHLFVWAYGDFQAEATASWHTTLTVPAGGSREVFLRFVVPPLVLTGDTEGDHPHRWRSRVRVDLLVNGFPAWSTEATRLRSAWSTCETDGCAGQLTTENVTLVQFGRPLAFATDDEDSSTSNDSTSIPLRNSPSASRTVHMTLGRHAQNTRLHLAWVMRGTAWSEPKTAGGTDHRCEWDPVPDRWFCSRANLSLAGSAADAPELRFGP